MKRRAWFAVAATGLVVVVAAAYLLEIRHFGPGGGNGGSNLTIREGPVAEQTLVKLDPNDVEVELPRFYKLLENAYTDGVGYTGDADLIQAIRKYVAEVSGSLEYNVNIEYRSKVFHLEYTIQ